MCGRGVGVGTTLGVAASVIAGAAVGEGAIASATLLSLPEP